MTPALQTEVPAVTPANANLDALVARILHGNPFEVNT